MPLYDLDNRQQNPVGRREHWRLFATFRKRPLHQAIVEELRGYIRNRQEIDSSWAGSEILSRLRSRSPELFEHENPEQTGGLFGMTLWHFLAECPDAWYFVPKADEMGEPAGTRYFRRH